MNYVLIDNKYLISYQTFLETDLNNEMCHFKWKRLQTRIVSIDTKKPSPIDNEYIGYEYFAHKLFVKPFILPMGLVTQKMFDAFANLPILKTSFYKIYCS